MGRSFEEVLATIPHSQTFNINGTERVHTFTEEDRISAAREIIQREADEAKPTRDWVYLDIGEVVERFDVEVVIATIDYSREDVDAVGPLLAAAPDLLEALRSAERVLSGHGYFEWIGGSLHNIRAAIAKAEGR